MTFQTLQKFNQDEANPFDVVHTSSDTYVASDEELVITEANEVSLPEPSADAIVGIRDTGQRAIITSPSGQIHLREDGVIRAEETVYFVSDGIDWYTISDSQWFGADIPDSVVNQYPTDEGSGATLFDNKGTEDGTINGATWEALSDAVGGNFLSYDGVDDTTDFADTAFDYTASSTMTITAFVNPNDTASFRTIAIKDGGGDVGSNVRGWVIRISDTDNLEWVHPGVQPVGTLSVPVNTWSFVAARYDPGAGNVTLTVNDMEETVAIDPQRDDATGEVARFGATFDAERPFDGGVDEVTLSDTTLTDSELADLRARRSDV